MKSLIIKLDRQVFNFVSWYTRRWVARHDFKKHKIDFMIQVEWIQFGALIVWAVFLPAVLYALAGEPIIAAVHAFVWSLLAVMEWFSIQTTKNMLKPLHDWLFSQRENPAIYEMEKEHCENYFIESRRRRLQMFASLGGMTLFFFGVYMIGTGGFNPENMVWQYLLINSVVNMLVRYVYYVFDFDPPKKKKTVSETITDLVKALWADLVGGFVPQPAFSKL